MDIKMLLVMDLAKEYHCAILPERCMKCDAPLVRFGDQEFAFCIIDVVKNEYAAQDHKTLDTIKTLDKLCNPEPDKRYQTYIKGSVNWGPWLKGKNAA